ncbi:MAG: hypothetical protein U9O98_04195 [Asgard group archaeon]|nr:hypothetical protein [Asgard group archaeon]
MMNCSRVKNLLDEDLTQDDFRELIHSEYYSKDDNQIRSGRVAGNIWRFIHEMEVGNYVVMPTKKKFYVAKIAGPVYYNEKKKYVNAAYRRKITWLNYRIPIPKSRATPELQEKLNMGQTCIEISEVMKDIIFSLRTI